MDADHGLLFGLLVRQGLRIDDALIADAFAAWTQKPEGSFRDYLGRRAWLSEQAQQEVGRVLERALRKHGQDPQVALNAILEADRTRCLGKLAAGPEQTLDQVPQVTPLPETGATLVQTGPGSMRAGPDKGFPALRERYTRLRLYAEGGLGRVFVARDQDLQREVALKEVRPGLADNPHVRQRFLREAQVTGQLEHPNIVPVYELVCRTTGEEPFYVMRLVRGQTLDGAIEAYQQRRAAHKDDPLELRRLLAAFSTVCQALGYAHSRGVLHRDLKPENIVLGDFGEVVVLDWGLARVRGEPSPGEDQPGPIAAPAGTGHTEAGSLLGTPSYMAPEQALVRLDLVDERTDIYGLGGILFTILTGQAPHADACDSHTLAERAQGPSPRTRALNPAAPPALDAICAQAMAVDRAERYPSAAALAEDVQRYLADEPVSAWREPRLTRAARWMRRHRTGVLAGIAAVTVAAVCLATTSVLLLAANREVERQRDGARTHFQMAREAVDQFHTKVSDNPELKSRGLEFLRRDLLESAAAFYQRFVREEAGDGAVKSDQGLALLQLGDLYRSLGRRDRAEETYREALRIFQALGAADPTALDPQVSLADTYRSLGVLCASQSRSAEAEQAFQASLAACRPLLQTRPGQRHVLRALAAGYQELAIFYVAADRNGEAEAAFDQALKGWRQFVAEYPQDTDYQQDLAATLLDLGILYATTGRRERAEAPYQEARELAQSLVVAIPNRPEFQSLLADVLNSLAQIYSETSRPGPAAQAFEQARAQYQRLVEAHPHVAGYQADLATANNNLGVFYRNEGRDDLAEPYYRAAQETYQRLVDAYPQVTGYTVSLGGAQFNRGNLSCDLGQQAEALTWFARSRATLEGVLKKEPRQALANAFLPLAYGGEALALARLQRHAEAARSLQAAFKLCPGRAPADLKYFRVLVEALAGRHAPAVAEANDAAKDPELTSRQLVGLAGACALAAEAVARDTQLLATQGKRLREEYAVQAMALLRKARAAGYFKAGPTIDQLGQSPDLAALRPRADFQQFVRELNGRTGSQ
jgi:serine/threonine-protein kinase